MPLPDQSQVIVLTEFRKEDPWEGLRCEKQALPALQTGQCLVAMLHAPIHPSDINIMQGVYCHLPSQLPAGAGNEGCGQVIALGPETSNLEIGDVVISWSWGSWGQGAYAQYIVIECSRVMRVPSGIPPKVACMLAINPPTAWGLLHDAVSLTAGDWIVQNAANSAVGLAVLDVANVLGLHVINIVRREQAADIVRNAGAQHVFIDSDPELLERIQAATGDSSIRLALNAVCGASTRILSRCLAPGGSVVTYGAMAMEPITVQGGQLIFKDLRFLGFHLGRWMEKQSKADIAKMWKQLFSMAEAGKFAAPVEQEYPLSLYAYAVQHARRPGREGKILFTM